MAQEVGRWNKGEFVLASEFLSDQVGGAAILQRFDMVRIVGGKGWRTFDDDQGLVCFELTAEECDAYLEQKARGERDAVEKARVEEEQRRERARQMRDLGPASIRAPR